MVGEKGDFQFLLIEIEREKEGIRFTLHLSDLFSSVAIEGGSMESGCRFSNGITGGASHQMLPDRGDKGCGVCAEISDPAVV